MTLSHVMIALLAIAAAVTQSMVDPAASAKCSTGLSMRTRYRNPRVKPAWYRARQRSITPAQKRAEARLWPLYGLTFFHNAPLELNTAFGSPSVAPLVLEIGSGTGEALVEYASLRPDANFVGVDWFRSGLAQCLMELEERSLTNVKLVRADAATLLERGLSRDTTFDEVCIFFPDPWYGSPERRIVRPDVMRSISQRMRPSGLLHFASDVPGYPEHTRSVMTSSEACSGEWHEVSSADRLRPSTRYEREAISVGRPITDLCFVYDGPLEQQ